MWSDPLCLFRIIIAIIIAIIAIIIAIIITAPSSSWLMTFVYRKIPLFLKRIPVNSS